AALGLPYAFASHFAPQALLPALAVYRDGFRPSRQLDRPYAMVAADVVMADTDTAARKLFTSVQCGFTNLLRGRRSRLQPPLDDIASWWTPAEEKQVTQMLACSFVGAPRTVREDLQRFLSRTGADELM